MPRIVHLQRHGLHEERETPIDSLEPRYTEPLRLSDRALERSLPPDCKVVLLGSIATNKYCEFLAEIFGPRLMFPREFIGRGGPMLWAVEARNELEYVSLIAVESRRGQRPPKLPT